MNMKRSGIFAVAALSGLLLSGCGRGQVVQRLEQIAVVTEETLTDILVGTPPERRSLNSTGLQDKPLLEKGIYETVVLSADARAFAQLSRGAIAVKEIEATQQDVVRHLERRLKPRGFAVRSAPYPPDLSNTTHTLLATLTPHTAESADPQRRPPLVMIRLTLTDATTNRILTTRDYYSGRDVRVKM
jgi:hypothetical protein